MIAALFVETDGTDPGPARNRLIVEAVIRHNGIGINLILSDRREHCEALADVLREQGPGNNNIKKSAFFLK